MADVQLSHRMLNFSILLSVILLSTSAQIPHSHISQELYDSLTVFAHLIDISYCISPISRITPPFSCDNGCDAFNDTEVVYQWCPERDLGDSTRSSQFAISGYMALWHTEKTILIVLRGTRSFKDALIDLNSEMSPYRESSVVCEGCRVHKGFYASFLLTWDKLRDFIAYYKDAFKDYEFKVMGHSLGGSVSVFIGLKLRQTYPDIHLQVITMGQPMAGNSQFAKYVDLMMRLDQDNPFYNGDVLRITHKHDPVVKLPITDSYNIILGDRYTHSGNEIFINDTRIDNHEPLLKNVIYCDGNEDYQCASGMRFTRDNRQHLNYFRRMGRCGFGFI